MSLNYKIPAEEDHYSKLKKIEFLKGVTLTGEDEVKNLPQDRIVKEEGHILHGTVRGFYVPGECDYLLSYQATEKDENYGKQIIWENENRDSFKEIKMVPPDSGPEHLINRDIEAARNSMKQKYPIGVFFNKSKGINICLGLGLIETESEEGYFSVKPITFSEEEYQDIFKRRSFYIINTSNEETVKSIISKGRNTVEFKRFSWYEQEVDLGDIIFLRFGGDNPPWETGFAALGRVVRKPYDSGYERTGAGTGYYKIKVYLDLMLPKILNKEDYINYKKAIGIPNIGPELKNTPNQAIREINRENSVVIARGLLDKFKKLEDELLGLFGSEFIEEAKSETQIFIEKELRFGEKPEIYYTSPRNISESKWEPDIDKILTGLKIDESVIKNLKTYINNRKNIILMGPPGTGKTTIADRAAKDAVIGKYISKSKIVTATADWTTFDTIGGYMPKKHGSMEFVEGAFLESIRENSWLIIDEINRADIDKAFGEIFTVLSNRGVVLPYELNNGEKIKIKFNRGNEISYFNEEEAAYYIGDNWRIICTMNTFDKKALYEISFALMRRFAFVNVPNPEESEYKNLISENTEDDRIRNITETIKDLSPRSLGPAVILDLINYLESSEEINLTAGIHGLILPQFEGLKRSELKQFYKDIIENIDEINEENFKKTIISFFDIPVGKFEGEK